MKIYSQFLTILFVTLALDLSATMRYVDLYCATPVAPYLTWTNAATNIQDAIDAADAGDFIIVTNGTYQTGGRPVYGAQTNRVVVDKAVTVQSVNGPSSTAIQGSGINSSLRCVYLTNGATLSGFTLANGSTRFRVFDSPQESGGGVWCESTNAIVTNCVVRDNVAYQFGGGAYKGTLVNCVLTNNQLVGGFNGPPLGAGAYASTLIDCLVINNKATSGGGGGGGAYAGTLVNCLVTGNSAQNGGGAYNGNLLGCTVVSNTASASGGGVYSQGTVQNCIVYFNSAPAGTNIHGAKFDYCCTIPVFSYTPRSFTNAPLFINPAGGDFRLQSNSPCINAGDNSYAMNATDLGGNPRITGGTVDVGAYEFQTPGSTLSYAWAQQFGLATDGSVDFLDADSDGLNNWQEWHSNTDPTNALSLLQMYSPTSGVSGVTISWQSVGGITYFVQRSLDLGLAPFTIIKSNIFGAGGTMSYLDTNAIGAGPFFYRVGVR